MWNIVTIGDGNYLVDVTNSDDGQQRGGSASGLFMAWDKNNGCGNGYAFNTVYYDDAITLPMTDGRKICMEQEITPLF